MNRIVYLAILIIPLVLLSSCAQSVSKADYDKTVSDLSTVNSLSQSLQTQLSESKSQNQALQNQVSALQSKTDSLQKQVSDTSALFSDSKTQLSNMQTQLNATESEIQLLRSNNQVIKEKSNTTATAATGQIATPIMWSGGSTKNGPGSRQIYKTDGVDFNTAEGYFSTTGDGIFTVTVPGYYHINAQTIDLSSYTSKVRLIVDGIVVKYLEHTFPSLGATTNVEMDIIWPIKANKQFYLEYSCSGNNLSNCYLAWSSEGYSCYSRLQVTYLGPLQP
jgi:hypothetical protein